MQKERIYPVLLGVFSAIISFVAVVTLTIINFKMTPMWAILLGGVVSIFFYILSYFRLRASLEIKRIAREYHLSAFELAHLTGLQESDFPIYNSKLQLIVPRRHWPHILNVLRNYEAQMQEKK